MVGRNEEVKELNRIYDRNRAELVVIYGRRRVGKTYLVNETFGNRITFRHTGLSPLEYEEKGGLKAQLEHFQLSLKRYGMKSAHRPKDWLEAFFLLEQLLKERDNGTRQVVFIDELPWMDTKRSGFLTAFEAFWNGWGAAQKNLMLIVCGSAISWMQDNLLYHYGGLYDRITYSIKLSPFTIKECEEFYRFQNIKMSRYDIAQSYMAMGGIPYYVDYMREEWSLAQNLDRIFFAEKPLLYDEYNRLFGSIFKKPEQIKSIIEYLNTRRRGYTRQEIINGLKIESSGELTKWLNSLTASEFVTKYLPFGDGKKEEHYRLTDPFCLFYLHFIHNKNIQNRNYWQNNMNSPEVNSWRGIAFENICFTHIDQIKQALRIGGIDSSESAWTKMQDSDSKGTQIDMIIDRADNVINLCEIKFCSEEFEVDNQYEMLMKQRDSLLAKMVSKKKTVRNTLITTYGLKHNKYSGIFSNVVLLDDLFEGA